MAVNKKKILVVSTAETFTVRGLEMKLKNTGAEVSFSPMKIDDVSSKCDCGLVILYTDEGIEDAGDVLAFLKDRCGETGMRVAVIGSSGEYLTVKKVISGTHIIGFFERPLQMEEFLDAVENFFAHGGDENKRKSILIVDDDVTYMSMIMDWLKDQYHVSMANSGMQAITWLTKNMPDLILLDYEMPITSGPLVLEMIRSDDQLAGIPVMFLTGKGDRESIMKVLSLKPAGYILKTVDKAGLRENIANFFKA